MLRNSYGNSVLATGEIVTRSGEPLKNQGHGSGPKCGCKIFGIFGNLRGPSADMFLARDVNDHGVVRRSILCGEDPAYGNFVVGVGTEAINRFGGQDD